MDCHRLAPTAAGVIRLHWERYVEEERRRDEDWRRTLRQHRAAVCEGVDMAAAE